MKQLNRTILIVDDLDVSRTGVALTLRAVGLRTEEASSADEALNRCKKQPYDLVLLDCNLPGLNGFQCASELRKLGITTPIIGYSSYSESEAAQDCVLAGMNDFLNKSCSTHELIEKVEKWL